MCMLVLKLFELSKNTFKFKIKSCLRDYIDMRQHYGSKSEYFWENLKLRNYPFFVFFAHKVNENRLRRRLFGILLYKLVNTIK